MTNKVHESSVFSKRTESSFILSLSCFSYSNMTFLIVEVVVVDLMMVVVSYSTANMSTFLTPTPYWFQ